MQYLKVEWLHNNSQDPILLYSELDSNRLETRKVEVYVDGTRGYADQVESRGGTWLGIVSVPSLEEIANDPQFVPTVISDDEFEKVWDKRAERLRAHQ